MKMMTLIDNFKKKWMYTGWLQYMLTAIQSGIVLVFAGVFWLLRLLIIAKLLLILSVVLLCIMISDLITVKAKIHLKEKLPLRNDHLDPFDLMRARRACRSYQDRKLESKDLSELIDYIKQNKSQEDNFISGKGTVRFEYVCAALTVWPVVGAQEFLVAITPKDYNRLAIIDVGRNLQKVVNYATMMGLGTCWIGPGADQKSIISQLGDQFDETRDHVVCVCAIGYASKHIPLTIRLMGILQHRRLPLSKLFFEDATNQKPLDIGTEPFMKYGRCYEVCQWSPSSFNNQLARCVGVLKPSDKTSKDEESTVERFDFYSSVHSRFYAALSVGIWCTNWELGCNALGIRGHFEVVKEKVDHQGEDTLPSYDLSWMAEN